MRECDSKYREICFNRALKITQSRKIKQIRVCLGLLQDVLFTVRRDNVDKDLRREEERKRKNKTKQNKKTQPTLVGSEK